MAPKETVGGSSIQLLSTVPKGSPDPSFTDSNSPARGYPLRRFWFRTSVLLLGPVIIFIYFLMIWLFFFRDTDTVKYRSREGTWVYYSWFVTGVFGLNISRYGLVGVEAAMLQEPFWGPKSAMGLLMHSGSTWAGPGGWMKCIQRAISMERNLAGRLWYVLAVLSLVPLVAFPISGLSMELADGYIASSAPPMVVGREWSNFHRREPDQTKKRGGTVWRTASAVIPGIGIAYSPPQVDREKFEFLTTLPNSLSFDPGIPELFLGPQATTPIGGKAWGLRLQYNCSMVQSASEFTILSQKSSALKPNNSGVIDDDSRYKPRYKTLQTPSGATITFFNSTQAIGGNNLWAYAEMGVSHDFVSSTYDGSEPSFESGEPEILEYALWQVRRPCSYDGDDRITFNYTLKPSIAGMGSPIIQNPSGKFERNASFFDWSNGTSTDTKDFVSFVAYESFQENITLAPPIGVQCRRISDLGTAKLDSRTSTFSEFEKSPSPIWSAAEYEAKQPRFGATAISILLGRYTEIFESTKSPLPYILSNSACYDHFVQPQVLLQSVLQAHAVDALQLMYDGATGLNGGYVNTNLTSSRRGKVLEPGVVPPLVSTLLLGIWATGCIVLGVMYGFRRRWSDTLDGYSLFRFGVGFGEELRNKNALSSTQGLEKSDRLWSLPGMIGDSRMQFDIGHISLVGKDQAVNPSKLYT
ncbi:hypothetical protein MGYG_06582 [Nannizzia gypsea CBS 118893]|uniref:Uncharacterized protein n=1 Tax=Arthroderma gypseum (strain ATCC MYA-4604 / CBS 118893) TaxID=535722 RepID=E4V2M6_ARTGP|nr:hypothetical protein MGYG_06582 [Nannizzia gypsea CBS 118893]EFR03588.1 hypothetical protein MGYG_06582 [Nannizzia gypsea CBS 118893]